MQGTSNCRIVWVWDPASELFVDVWNFKKHNEMTRWLVLLQKRNTHALLCVFFFFSGASGSVVALLVLKMILQRFHLFKQCRKTPSLNFPRTDFRWASCMTLPVTVVICEILLPGQVWKTWALKLKETSHLKAFDIFWWSFWLGATESSSAILPNFLQLFGWWYFELLRCLVGKQHFKTGHGGGGRASTGAETLVNLSWFNFSSIPKKLFMNLGVGFDLNGWKLCQNGISLCHEIFDMLISRFLGWSLTCLETLT